MDISILVVTYNSAGFIKDCLESLLQQKDVEFEIIVVDNASRDETVSILESYRDRLRFITSSKNLGFGKANNLGSQLANAEWLFLMNPDAKISDEFGLKRLLHYAKANPQQGLIGTKIISTDGKKETKPFLTMPGERHIKSPYKRLPGKIAWVLGASLFVSRELYAQVKGFDESFFLYGEDTDLCLRIRKLGYEVGHCSAVTIVHIGGASEKEVGQYDRTYKKQKALYLFYKKHYSASDVMHLLRRDFWRSIYLRGWYFIFRVVTLDRCGSRKYSRQKAIGDSSWLFLKEEKCNEYR